MLYFVSVSILNENPVQLFYKVNLLPIRLFWSG